MNRPDRHRRHDRVARSGNLQRSARPPTGPPGPGRGIGGPWGRPPAHLATAERLAQSPLRDAGRFGLAPLPRVAALRLVASNPEAAARPEDTPRAELRLVVSRRFVPAAQEAPRPVEVASLRRAPEPRRHRVEALLVLAMAAGGIAALAASIGQILAPLLD